MGTSPHVPPPGHWMHDARARKVRGRFSIGFMLLGLAAAAGVRSAYQHALQAPACFAYAQGRLGDIEQLRFAGARIAARERVHVCYFRHERLGTTIALPFDRAHIPNARDGGEIASIIGAFGLVSLAGWWRWRRWLSRNGFA